jgi:hypothetical protein
MALVVLPAWNVVTHDAYAWSLHADLGAADFLLTPISWAVHAILIRAETVVFDQTFLILMIFVGILLANRFITRFWCRGLCPLGALLGLLSNSRNAPRSARAVIAVNSIARERTIRSRARPGIRRNAICA